MPIPHPRRSGTRWHVRAAPYRGLLLIGLACGCAAVGAADAPAFSGLHAAFKPQALGPAGAERPAGGTAAAAAPGAADWQGDSAATGGPAGLQVVVIRGSRALASIDGRLVRVGDRVGGMRVRQISAKGVVLVDEGGASERLLVSPQVVKRVHPAGGPGVSNGVPR